MSLKSKRFKEMEQTGNAIAGEIDYLAAMLKRYSFANDKKIENYVLGYFRYKIGKKPLRAYTCRKFFEYLIYEKTGKGESTLHEIVDEATRQLFMCRLPMAFELIITIQYLHNHILDEKQNLRPSNQPQVCKTLLSSNILKELLFEYLEERVHPLISDQQAIYLTKSVRRLFLCVDLGQRIDKQYNSYHYWKHEEDLPFMLEDQFLIDDTTRILMQPHLLEVWQSLKKGHLFSGWYFHRIYLTNVYFFRAMVEIVANLTQASETEASRQLIDFSILYGFMLQIINDYADYAYSPDEKERKMLRSAGKKTTDIFADLYNSNVTLPLIFHLQEGAKRKIEAYLEGNRKRKKIISTYSKQIMQEIVQSGGIRKSILLSRQLSKTAVRHLNPENSASPYLTNMCDIAMNNKFYQIFK